MAFSTFSKDFTANMFTSVENQFITKYLPQADGDCVRVYLYGLYLCQCADEFDAQSCAKLLRITPQRLLEIFSYWEECDLVHILSRDPLYVQYLPVNAAIGKPKSIRAEKYGEFNRELFRQLQTAKVMFKPYEHQRILEFLENYPMEQQAFLLVSEYCVKKDGEKLTSSHILNKAKKLCSEHKYTYEQVEQELADFNVHEKELTRLFAQLSIFRKPKEEDYALLDKWAELGMEFPAVLLCANSLKKPSLPLLDALVLELSERGIHAQKEAKEYLARREAVVSVVYATAKKLGVKVENPRAYAEEYVEKWMERGYDEESLSLVASLAFKLHYAFPEMDGLLDSMYASGIVDGEGVKQYCAVRDREWKLLQKIQTVCGVIAKSQSTLDMVATWKAWNFSDAMILEAAKRSANAAVPLPYMNKLLSEWKRAGVYEVSEIPEKSASVATVKPTVKDEATVAADKRSEWEHHYSVLRTRALEKADRARKQAEKNADYKRAVEVIKKGEIALAKAEVFEPERVAGIQAELNAWLNLRDQALASLGLTEASFQPEFTCKKCSDTGYLPNGRICDCYPKQ